MKQLFALDFFFFLILYKQLEFIKIKSNYWSLLFLYIKADNNFNNREKERETKSTQRLQCQLHKKVAFLLVLHPHLPISYLHFI